MNVGTPRSDRVIKFGRSAAVGLLPDALAADAADRARQRRQALGPDLAATVRAPPVGARRARLGFGMDDPLDGLCHRLLAHRLGRVGVAEPPAHASRLRPAAGPRPHSETSYL